MRSGSMRWPSHHCMPLASRSTSLEIEPERLADIAQCAARSVADDGGRQRGAFAAVFAVNVLNDLFAPLVLEIDVDIRRLVALLGNEPLEQHGHARGIHFRDLQAVADDGIGGRAAALAEDVLRAGVLNDIVHGEKKGLELELRDQAQLVLDTLAHGGRRALRPALGAALPGQGAQMAGGSFARGHDFLGILVAQLIEIERAALGDGERLREQRGGIELAQRARGGAGSARRSETGARPPRARAILRRMAVSTSCRARRLRRCMCTSPAATGGSSSVSPSACKQRQAPRIGAAGQELDAEPQAPCETLAQPATVLAWCGSSARPVCGSQMIRHPSSAFSRSCALEDIAAFGRSRAGRG